MSIPTLAELEKRWWHRLTKIIIWIISGLTAVISLLGFVATYSDYGEFNPYSLLWLLLAPVVYFLLSLFYRKLILYIAFGRDDNKPKRNHINKIVLIFATIKKNKPKVLAGIFALLVFACIAYYVEQRNDLRDLRYRAYEANLRIGSSYNRDSYLELLTTDRYSFQSTAESLTDDKVVVLNMVMSDLYNLATDCAKHSVCKERLGDHIIAMSNSIEAGREYYDKLKKGVDDITFIRDRAVEMNRAVRMKYLITPDPKFPSFTKEQFTTLLDMQWSTNFHDLVKAKKLCDEVTPYMIDSGTYTNICEEDLFLSMFTFNFKDGQENPPNDLQTVCDLEKNYQQTPTCPITLAKVETLRKKYANYLSTHENPYYSVSELPDKISEKETPDEQSKVVASFYGALTNGRGDLAVKFITPKKQETGSFTAEGLTNFWGNLLMPLGVLKIAPSIKEENTQVVGYMYQASGKETCIDTAKVHLELIEDTWYIDLITPEEGC